MKNERDLSKFKKSIAGMIATSNASYNGNTSFRKASEVGQYTKEEVLDILQTGDPDQLREVSTFYYYSNGFYRRLLTYYATMLLYTYVVIPKMSDSSKEMDKKSRKKYDQSLSFLSSLKIKDLCGQIAIKVLAEGAYYGVLRDYGADGIAVQSLPAKYCRSRFKNQQNIDIVEMDITYFDSIRDKKTREEALASYPKEIRKGYNTYKNGTGVSKWVMIEPGDGLYFNLYEERPFFFNVLPAIIDFEQYREIEKTKDLKDTKGLLIQKLPVEKGELVFDPEEAEEIHKGTVEMLRSNKEIDVLTTFADVDLADLQGARSVIVNNLDKIERTIYSEAGTSKQLFAAEGNIALANSIKNDLSLIMTLADKISNWLGYNVNVRYSDKGVSFKTLILPITYYNSTDMKKDTLEMAQSGYSFILPFLCLGLEQSDLSDLKKLEIGVLKLNEIMIPLASSFTQSNTAGAAKTPGKETDPAEVNKKPVEKQDDKTIKNNDAK